MARMFRQRTAYTLTAGVLALQAALLLSFAFDPADPPAYGSLGAAFWALARRPQFYLLLLFLLAAPIGSWLALTVPGPHRRPLAFAWLGFTGLALTLYGYRLFTMLQFLYHHMP